MSTEYIREVNIREGKVYLTSKSSNDDIPYHAWCCESLSRIYSEEGQQGLDREILRMLCEYATLNGTHPSITRYVALAVIRAVAIPSQVAGSANSSGSKSRGAALPAAARCFSFDFYKKELRKWKSKRYQFGRRPI